LEIIHEFDAAIDDAVALYLDSQVAMTMFSETLTKLQLRIAAQERLSVQHLDQLSYTYGNGDPNDPPSVGLVSVTQGMVKARNAKGGRNHLLLGQRFIVDLYSFWEDGYRSKIAEALNQERGSIRSDVFGDIRHLRNSVVHHFGIALPDITKCKILK
jgi:hypothetical protein